MDNENCVSLLCSLHSVFRSREQGRRSDVCCNLEVSTAGQIDFVCFESTEILTFTSFKSTTRIASTLAFVAKGPGYA